MPVRIPDRRSFLRRHTPSRDTLHNLVATTVEFGGALLFVAATVYLIVILNAGSSLQQSQVPPAFQTLFGP